MTFGTPGRSPHPGGFDIARDTTAGLPLALVAERSTVRLAHLAGALPCGPAHYEAGPGGRRKIVIEWPTWSIGRLVRINAFNRPSALSIQSSDTTSRPVT